MEAFINDTAGRHIDHALSRATWLLIDWLTTAPARLRRNAEYRRAQAQLQSLDDHYLRDLGIHRGDIPLVVRGIAGRRAKP